MMLCSFCEKLAKYKTNKKCPKCNGIININISCICDNCSNSDLICSVCLKKILNENERKNKIFGGGCGSCKK